MKLKSFTDFKSFTVCINRNYNDFNLYLTYLSVSNNLEREEFISFRCGVRYKINCHCVSSFCGLWFYLVKMLSVIDRNCNVFLKKTTIFATDIAQYFAGKQIIHGLLSFVKSRCSSCNSNELRAINCF